MSRLSQLNDRALHIAGRVGDTLRDAVPDHAMRWVETGAALGAVKAGSRSAGRLVRRHPVMLATAAVAGAGLLAWALRKRAQRKAAGQAHGEVIEGQAQRLDAAAGQRGTTQRQSAAEAGAQA